MAVLSAFDGIEPDNVKKMLSCFAAANLKYKKDTTILSNVANTTKVGVILSGSAEVIRYNFNGSRTIIERLGEGDIFGYISARYSEDLYVISTSETEIVLFDYDRMINRCKKNCEYHNHLLDNMLQILSEKLKEYNERIEVLTKKTIREKLLAYFNTLSKKQISSVIYLPFSLTDLADYLSIDRSAMMRELKNLREDGVIETKGKRIKLIQS